MEHKIFPVERAGMLQSPLRKWMTNSSKMIKSYISEGMTVLDFGCGPGVYTLEIAKLLNGTGKIIAADIQQGMLDILKNKIAGTRDEQCIELHKCSEQSVGVKEPVDFILAHYVIHETPNQKVLFEELSGILKPNGKMLIAEPKLHVTKERFDEMLHLLAALNWKVQKTANRFLSRVVVLTK
jgi:ubiquinone/menaquinone biosynthesis C-methylase UbiE